MFKIGKEISAIEQQFMSVVKSKEDIEELQDTSKQHLNTESNQLEEVFGLIDSRLNQLNKEIGDVKQPKLQEVIEDQACIDLEKEIDLIMKEQDQELDKLMGEYKNELE